MATFCQNHDAQFSTAAMTVPGAVHVPPFVPEQNTGPVLGPGSMAGVLHVPELEFDPVCQENRSTEDLTDLFAEPMDLLGLTLLPPQSSTLAVSPTDLGKGSDNFAGTEGAMDPDSYEYFPAAFENERASPQSCSGNSDDWTMGTAAVYCSERPGAGTDAGTTPPIPSLQSAQKTVVYVDLPSRSVFTRSIVLQVPQRTRS